MRSASVMFSPPTLHSVAAGTSSRVHWKMRGACGITSEYILTSILPPEGLQLRWIYLFGQRVVNQLSFAFVSIYLVSILPICPQGIAAKNRKVQTNFLARSLLVGVCLFCA